MGLIRPLALALATLALSACATQPPRVPSPWELPRRPTPPVVEQPPQPIPPVTLELSALPGWAQEDHAGAYAAYLQTCHVARDPAYAAVCRQARVSGPLSGDFARRFFETNFRAEPSGPWRRRRRRTDRAPHGRSAGRRRRRPRGPPAPSRAGP